MRKSLVMCVLMISLLLVGCAGKGNGTPMDRALELRGEYLSANGCAARVQVTADYGQRVYDYGLDVQIGGGETVLTVRQPAEIAGITARLRDGESLLEYDGAVLETGPLSEDGLTPLTAVTALFEAMRNGFIDSCGTQGEELYILCREPEKRVGDGREIALWVGADGCLRRGEVFVDGRRVMGCEFASFALN